MKVLLINGSPHENGCTYVALNEVSETLKNDGIETEIVWIGDEIQGGCKGCHACRKLGQCVVDDSVNLIRKKICECDGVVFGSPVHYAAMSGSMASFMDRLFYSEMMGNKNKNVYMKPAAAVLTARRAGTTAAFDQMIKYFTIAEMPVVSSRYWNMVHGAVASDVSEDKEGLYTMRVLARNMGYLLKCIEAGKSAGVNLPEYEKAVFTNFVR